MAGKQSPKDVDTQKDAGIMTPAADEQAFFFPNTEADAPFGCHAKSLEAATKLNDEYLKDHKDIK